MALNNARVDSKYKDLLKNIYNNVSIKIAEDINKIPIEEGVRQDKLSHILTDKNIPINVKLKVFSSCIFPAATTNGINHVYY